MPPASTAPSSAYLESNVPLVGKADAHPPHVQRRLKKRARHGLPASNNGSYREYASGSHAATIMLTLLAELGHTGLRRTRVSQPNSI